MQHPLLLLLWTIVRFNIVIIIVVTADILGDTSFLNFVADPLKIPVGSLNSSYCNQDIKMMIRDHYKLMSLVDLREFPSSKGNGEFLNRELKDLVPCCRQTSHCSCL